MSTVRYFDVPHVVRFGNTSEEKGTSWMKFYRSATCFEVFVSQTDVVGTPFGQRWHQLLVAKKQGGVRSGWIERWNDLCDCIIAHILPTLQDLAPASLRSWTTFEDYLSTPTYKLRIHKPEKDGEEGDTVVEIISGPTAKSAFSLQPQPLNSVALPADLPGFEASELKVLDQNKDLRQQPYKVLMPGGTIAYLVPAEVQHRMMPSGRISHPSMSNIKSQLALHSHFFNDKELQELPACLPKVLAVVNTSSFADRPAADATESVATQPQKETLFAGILLTYLPQARYLRDSTIISQVATSANPDQLRRTWHQSLSNTLTMLHTRSGILHGNINPHTILIASTHISLRQGCDRKAEEVQPYLVHFSEGVSDNFFADPALAGTAGADWDGLANTLGDSGWLVHEVKKFRKEISGSDKWRRPTIT